MPSPKTMKSSTSWRSKARPAVDIRIFAEGRLTVEQIRELLQEIAGRWLKPKITGGHFAGGGLWSLLSMPRPLDLPSPTDKSLGQFRDSIASADLFNQIQAMHERCMAYEARLEHPDILVAQERERCAQRLADDYGWDLTEARNALVPDDEGR